MTKSKYITSPPSDMVLPGHITSAKGNVYETEEALSIARAVLSGCVAWSERAYIQDSELKKALKRSLKHLYGLRVKLKNH